MSTPPPPAPPPQPPPPSTSPDTDAKWRYGLIVVISAFVAIIVIFVVGAIRYPTAADAGALVPAIVTSISTLAAAYFGIQVGSSGKEQAERGKDAAKDDAIALAAATPHDSDMAQRIVQRHAARNTAI